MLSEFKASLRAYAVRDLQNFQFFLARMEAAGIPLPTARQAVTEAVAEYARAVSKRRHRAVEVPTEPVVPLEYCPECGDISTRLLVDEVVIQACKSCRWSALVEE